MYLYQTTIFKRPDEVIGITAEEVTEHVNAKADYLTNHEASTLKLSKVQVSETTFFIDKTYSEFEQLITNWADVKQVEDDMTIILYIDNPTQL